MAKKAAAAATATEEPRPGGRRPGYDVEAKGGFYPVHGELLPRVTSIIGMMDKSGPLTWWAGNEERKLWRETAAQLLRDFAVQLREGHVTHATFNPERAIATLEERVGPTLACKRRLSAAGNIGSAIHDNIRAILKTEIGEDHAPAQAPRTQQMADAVGLATMAWEDWRKAHDFKPISVEKLLFHRIIGYAGRMDVIGTMRHRQVDGTMGPETLAVVDWKSGKAVYDEMSMQSVAYREAVPHSLRETDPDGWDIVCAQARALGHDPEAEPPSAWLTGHIVVLPKELWPAGADVPIFPHTVDAPYSQTLEAFIGLRDALNWSKMMEGRR